MGDLMYVTRLVAVGLFPFNWLAKYINSYGTYNHDGLDPFKKISVSKDNSFYNNILLPLVRR